MTIDTIFSKEFDSQIAVVEDDREWTYREFSEYVYQFATFLNQNNIKKILIDLPQGFNSYILLWGAYISGTTFCPISNLLPEERKRYYILEFKPDLIISNSNYSFRCSSKIIKDLSTIFSDDSLRDKLLFQPIPSNEIAYVIFTSGSTGLPKGVKISRKSLQNFLNWSTIEYRVQPNDRWAQYSNMGFDLSICDIFTVILCKGVLVCFKEIAEKLFPGKAIARNKIKFWQSVPTVINLLSERSHITTEILGGLKVMTFCGEPLYPFQVKMLFEANPNLIIYNTYGPTEGTIFCTFQKLTFSNYEQYCERTVSIGKPIPGYQIRLKNVIDNIGEIIICGKYISDGYLNETDIEGNFLITLRNGEIERAYNTGDFGYFVGNNLYFAYRKDTQIKIHGNRIDLTEIDYYIREFGYNVCASIYHAKKIISFVQSATLKENELREFLKTKLPNYYLPNLIINRLTMPYTTNNKIDIRKLKQSIDNLI